MRALPIVVLVSGLALVAEGQPPSLVPVGGMTAGCPSTWAHRTGSSASFECRDTTSGAFCSGSARDVRGATQADEVAALRSETVARGFTVLREADHAGVHELVYDDAAGHRIAAFVRRSPSRAVVVTCGSTPTTFDANEALFVEVASSAR